MIGRAIAHYRVTSKLGSGGMGVVYAVVAEDLPGPGTAFLP